VTSLILATAMHLTLAANPCDSYAEARQRTMETGRPMVVMVTAEWCAACKDMEKRVLPRIRRGLLGRVVYCHVDLDKERELGDQLRAGGPIPQLIAFRRTEQGWHNTRLIGGHSVERVEQFLEEQIGDEKSDGPAKAAKAKPGAPKAEPAGDVVADSKKSPIKPVARQ